MTSLSIRAMSEYQLRATIRAMLETLEVDNAVVDIDEAMDSGRGAVIELCEVTASVGKENARLVKDITTLITDTWAPGCWPIG